MPLLLQTVRRLEAEVAQKKADLEVSHKKMAEASDALSKSLQAISELSRVSNDLRNRIVANEPLRKVWFQGCSSHGLLIPCGFRGAHPTRTRYLLYMVCAAACPLDRTTCRKIA
jgi:hypothetical protein